MENYSRGRLVNVIDLDWLRIRCVNRDGTSLDAYILRELVFDEEHGAFVLADVDGRVILDLRDQLALLLLERRQVVRQVAPAFAA